MLLSATIVTVITVIVVAVYDFRYGCALQAVLRDAYVAAYSSLICRVCGRPQGGRGYVLMRTKGKRVIFCYIFADVLYG